MILSEHRRLMRWWYSGEWWANGRLMFSTQCDAIRLIPSGDVR